MRFFKRFAALALAIVSALTLAACNKQSLDADGKYWFSDATGFPLGFEETLTYNVSVKENTPFDSTVVKSDNIKLNILNGTYVTTLKTINFGERESLMHFQKVLRDNGVIDALEKAGCGEGKTVSIYDFEFEFVE